MKTDELVSKCWELSCVAGMNQRYYSELAGKYSNHVLMLYIATFASAIAMVFILQFEQTILKKRATQIISVGTIYGMAFLGTVTSDYQPRIVRLNCYWTQLRADADGLSISAKSAGEDAPKWLQDRMVDLQTRRIRIMADEPKTDEALLWKCYRAECKSRGVEVVSELRKND